MDSLTEYAFAHAAWANEQLLDVCGQLGEAQLATLVPGTDKSILETLRHFIGDDSFELFVASDEWPGYEDAGAMGLEELRALSRRNAEGWDELLAMDPDASRIMREVDPDDGFQRDSPLSTRVVAALHHGNDHRTQICTALTVLGVKPPDLTVWRFALEKGHSVEVYPGGEPTDQ
jgi:uncharacterized damage-inducible protein DinB